jgi:hypothetical protein
MIKSRSMRLAGHIALMGIRDTLVGYWWESQREGDHWKDQDLGNIN